MKLHLYSLSSSSLLLYKPTSTRRRKTQTKHTHQLALKSFFFFVSSTMASSKIFLASSILMALMFSSMITSSVAAKQLTKKKMLRRRFLDLISPNPVFIFQDPVSQPIQCHSLSSPNPVFLSFRVLVSQNSLSFPNLFPFFSSSNTLWKPQAGSIHLAAALSPCNSHYQPLSCLYTDLIV